MENYFEIVIKEAYKAFNKKDIPVGALIVKNGKILAKSHNNRQKKHDVLGHAEINCIKIASRKLKDWRLDGCTMYVSLEPCDMCKTLINESRIDQIFYLLPQKTKKNVNISNFSHLDRKSVV